MLNGIGRSIVWVAIVGAIAVSPAIYFVIGNILTFELVLFPSVEIRSVSPIVLLGGCTIAALLNLWTILASFQRDNGLIRWFVEVLRTRRSNLVVSGVGFFFLAFLLAYAILENWMPH